MNRRIVFVIVLLLLSVTTAGADNRPEKPNVVLILADDLGWQDVKCYDIDKPCPMETPNIDALSKRGVMFWQAYSPAPTCGPSRCAIMSGTHPARAQMTHVGGGKPPRPHHKRGWAYMSPWYTARMPADEISLAKALKQHGYATACVGKWHLGMNWTDTSGQILPPRDLEGRSPPRSGTEVDFSIAALA